MNNKYIGILTSGGDASGMNAAIRAVTRTAIFNGFKIKGIYRGYEGLIAGEVKELTTEDVSSIIQRGGTILKTARSEAFTTPEGRKKAYEVIQKENISALIIIGGDGSLTGARIFAEEYNVTCIEINDLLQSIERGTAPLVDGVQGKRSLELITAMYKSAITRSVVSLPVGRDDPFYRTGGTNALAPRFYEKSASVANFSEVGAIPLGKDLDRGL